MNSFAKTSMVRPGWGATGNSGPELTRGCYALKTQAPPTIPPPPVVAKFLCQYTYHKNVQRDEGVILSNICWGPGAPLPFSWPDPPPDPAPPPPLKLAGKWEGVGVWPVAPPPPLWTQPPSQCQAPAFSSKGKLPGNAAHHCRRNTW